MASVNNWIKHIVAIAGAILTVVLLDWIIPGGSIFPDVYNLTWERIKYIGIAVIVLVVVVLGITFYGLTKSMSEDPLVKEAVTRVLAKILQRLRENRITARVVGDWLETRDPTLPDELPFVLKDLRVHLYTMMNFMLRHEIYKAKTNSVHKLVVELEGGKLHKEGQEIEVTGREDILVERIGTKEAINRNMRKYIYGGKIEKYDPSGRWRMLPHPDSGLSTVGFAHSYYLVLKLMEQLKEDLESYNLKIEPLSKGEHFAEQVGEQANLWAELEEGTPLNTFKSQIEQNYSRYITTVRRFKAVNLIESHWLYFLDMYNLYGVYKRGWRFAKKGTLPELHTYTIKSDNGITRDIDLGNTVMTGMATKTANYEPGSHYFIEVDTYGYSTSDINAIQVERKDLPYIRKWRNSDISYVFKDDKERPRVGQVLAYAYQDWQFFLEDFEKGNYHPYSRSITDYTEPISKGHMNFNLAKFKGLLTEAQIGFDLEAAKNPGEYIYWGRKRFFDKDKTSLREEPVNPYPMLSFFGLWDFINKVAVKRVKEPEIAKKYLDYFKMNYRELERVESQGGGGGHGH